MHSFAFLDLLPSFLYRCALCLFRSIRGCIFATFATAVLVHLGTVIANLLYTSSLSPRQTHKKPRLRQRSRRSATAGWNRRSIKALASYRHCKAEANGWIVALINLQFQSAFALLCDLWRRLGFLCVCRGLRDDVYKRLAIIVPKWTNTAVAKVAINTASYWSKEA
jgi:hypothetical protein